MFLDNKNCYHIDGYGLFVFFPEIGDVLFYSEKDFDKNRVFKCVQDPLQKYHHSLQEPPQKQGILSRVKSAVKLACKKETDILFVSENNSENFARFFVTERMNKAEPVKARGQIDYLLVIKSSNAVLHSSKPEYRILRIDWGKSQIKYYGEDDFFKINDYHVPTEFHIKGITSRCKLRDLESLPALASISDSSIPAKQTSQVIDHYRNYREQLQSNGFCQFLADVPLQTSLFNGLLDSLKASGFFKADASIESIKSILDMLDSSLLKTNWLNQFTGEKSIMFKEFLNSISIIPDSPDSTINNLTKKADESGYYLLINNLDNIDYMKDKSLVFTIDYNASEIKFTLNLDTLLKGQTESNKVKGKFSNCGADNCYFKVQDDSGASYGLRINLNVYTIENVVLYNLIIENLINAVLYYYFNNPELIGASDSLPEITRVLKFGFIKVRFTDKEMPDSVLEGYVPYTLSDLKPEYITLGDYIKVLCDEGNALQRCDVDAFIRNVLKQVYNFFVIARPYFKFSHNDFKINNILINRDNRKLYLIDFGYAQMNLFSDSRIYYLTNRLFFQYEGGESDEYNWYMKNIDEMIYSDNDIETLIYWLINIFEKHELVSNNKKIYTDTVRYILEYLQPITTFKPAASKEVRTVIGNIIYKNPSIKFECLPLIYRLYQIYSLLRLIKTECHIPIESKLIEKRTINFYRKYIVTFNEEEYLKYQSILLPLLSSSQAGGKSKKSRTIKRNYRSRSRRSRHSRHSRTFRSYKVSKNKKNNLHFYK